MEIDFKIDTTAFKASIDRVGENYEAAFATAKNMIASMMLEEVTEDIRSAGNFGERFLGGLTVKVDGEAIVTTLDAPGALIFEQGGTIEGNPLLWIPFSGTDAEGVQAKDYGDQLFSVNRNAGGPPLLFSVADRSPKYFGVPSVTIPKKFHIGEIQSRVMDNFEAIFQEAVRNG